MTGGYKSTWEFHSPGTLGRDIVILVTLRTRWHGEQMGIAAFAILLVVRALAGVN